MKGFGESRRGLVLRGVLYVAGLALSFASLVGGMLVASADIPENREVAVSITAELAQEQARIAAEQVKEAHTSAAQAKKNEQKETAPKKTPAKPVESTGEKPHTHKWTMAYKQYAKVPAKGYYQTIPEVKKRVQYVYFGNGEKIRSEDVPYADYANVYAGQLGTKWWVGYEEVVTEPESKRWVETSPGKAAWKEPLRYECACGATRKL